MIKVQREENIIKALSLVVRVFLVLSVSLVSKVHATSLTVSLDELDTAIEQMGANEEAVQRLVLQRIEQALNDAELEFEEGELLLTDRAENLIEDNSCTRTEVRWVDTTVALSSDTALSLSLASVNEPIQINLDISARVEADGRAKQIVGFRLGSCQTLAEDNFSFTATGQLDLSLSLRIVLNPVLETSRQRLVLRPVITLNGSLVSSDVRVDVDDSILRSSLERILEAEIDDALTDSELSNTLTRLETSLNETLDEELDQGLLIVELPSPTDEQISRLYTLLSPEGDFSLSLGYLRVRRIELLAALVTGDDETLQSLLSSAAQCEAAGLLQIPLIPAPLYQLAGDGCELLAAYQMPVDDSADGNAADANTVLYSDAQCQREFDFKSSSNIDFCEYVLDAQRLGNADSNVPPLDHWTLSTGTRFDIGALPLADRVQPITQRISYKQVDTAQGECSLEMRIHTIVPDAISLSDNTVNESLGSTGTAFQGRATQPLRPLIAFHGGSWQRRSSGALGIEAIATQFANEGYLVFAPFYRLIDIEEGTAACNDASLSDVLDDAHDALDWVVANAERYGASGKPVVFGQSAGGHMSAVLAVERPDEIASAVLFYAPTDFADFATQIISGQIDSVTGQSILETVVDQTLDTLDINAPLVRRNTLTERIVDEVIITPPLFMLHGMEDTVLPFRQSVRLCDALAGDPNAGAASQAVLTDPSDPLRRIINCGFDASELHLITEGEHALDLCIAEELCLAGSPDSAAKTADSVQRMLDWLKEVDLAEAQMLVASADDGSVEGTSGISNDASVGLTSNTGNVAGTATGNSQAVTTGGKVGWLILTLLFFGLALRRLVARPLIRQ